MPAARFVALNAQHEQIEQNDTPSPPLEFEVPSRSWNTAEGQGAGVCDVKATGMAGLSFTSGKVMSVLEPRHDVRGRELVSCLNASYLLAGWPIEVYVLLDAENPGTTPAVLPGMYQLAGHTGIFRTPGVEGEALARRASGAWVLVAKGQNTVQQLEVLRHVTVSLNL